jgi:hypothetical protein
MYLLSTLNLRRGTLHALATNHREKQVLNFQHVFLLCFNFFKNIVGILLLHKYLPTK